MDSPAPSIERSRVAVIIGAGPAGLTAAREFLETTDLRPHVFEGSHEIGGISRTVEYKGNRIDIGGHRFFSKSDRVMDWWAKVLPVQHVEDADASELRYQGKSRPLPDGTSLDPEKTDEIMLVRHRLSRIYYERKFYNYPVTLDRDTIRNLGFWRLAKIGFSYLGARIRPRVEKNLEDFYVNRFGYQLYATFFRDYTEKVWGVPCAEIAADWGAQRVKGLSITKTLVHAVRQMLPKRRSADIAQKDVETSLIERFLYPKYGPGQMWEIVARSVEEDGGIVELGQRVESILVEDGRTVGVMVRDIDTGETRRVDADVVISTMPVKDLVANLDGIGVPAHVAEIASALPYRDFMTVGVLARRLKLRNETGISTRNDVVPDNWIYIQEPDVQVGRLQIFNNWSPYLVADPDTVWVGMEYFRYEGDELWSMSDEEMSQFGIAELAKIDVLDPGDVLDTTVLRVQKTYPAYFGSYARFDEVREFLDQIPNLYLIGRNGQHRYNNQDHSMLSAMEAVENIRTGRLDKSNIWDVNVEQEYHEKK